MDMSGLKEKTAKGLMWGALNTLSTQLLSALFGIFLARMLSPAEYGMVGMLTIFSALSAALQESGFTAALTNLKQVTRRDYNAVFWFSTLVSLTLYALLFLAAPLIARFFHQPELVALSRVVFLGFVFGGIGVAHAAYMFRNMMNREKTVLGILALTGSGAVGLTMAWHGCSYWSLAGQQLTYILIADAGRLYYVRWLPSLSIDLTPLRSMFAFSSKILLTNIINQLNANFLTFIFGRLFTPATLGGYTQAAKWNQMGCSLVSGTIQQVAQPVLASISDDEGRQLNVFRKMLRFTAFLSMPAMFGLGLIADFIVLLLGEQWADSVMLLRILCLGGAFLPIHTLYQNLFISHGRSDTYLWCTVAQIVVQTAVVLTAGLRGGVGVMVTAYVVLSVLWTAVWQMLARRMTGLRLWDMLKDIVPFFTAAMGCTAIAWVGAQDVSHPVLNILARIGIMAVMYIAIMKVGQVKIFDECCQFIKNKYSKQ